jgi:hypothetical protein
MSKLRVLPEGFDADDVTGSIPALSDGDQMMLHRKSDL